MEIMYFLVTKSILLRNTSRLSYRYQRITFDSRFNYCTFDIIKYSNFLDKMEEMWQRMFTSFLACLCLFFCHLLNAAFDARSFTAIIFAFPAITCTNTTWSRIFVASARLLNFIIFINVLVGIAFFTSFNTIFLFLLFSLFWISNFLSR